VNEGFYEVSVLHNYSSRNRWQKKSTQKDLFIATNEPVQIFHETGTIFLLRVECVEVEKKGIDPIHESL